MLSFTISYIFNSQRTEHSVNIWKTFINMTDTRLQMENYQGGVRNSNNASLIPKYRTKINEKESIFLP